MTRFLSLASFAIGFSIMGAEVAAGRLLAPSFGTSTLVWSSLIGVVLGGLAVGAMIGGRWSRRPTALREIFRAAKVAGVLLALVPAITRPIMRNALEHFLGGKLLPLAFGLGGVLAILVVPVVLLGAMSPVLVHHTATTRTDVGQASGRLGALGTLGSLAGTFACGVVLVPLFGTDLTFRACGALALAVGVIGSWLELRAAASSKRSVAITTAIAALVFLAAGFGHSGAIAANGTRVVLEKETAHNFIRVVDDASHRTLYLDEGYAKQTVARLDGHAYLHGVWGYYAIAPAFTKRVPERILVLGLGGGTSARDYKERLPNSEVVAVELDAGVVDVARRQFGLPASVEVHVEDARAFLARDQRTYDLVVVDAFQFPYVPFQLTTHEFFEDVRRHLSEGGALMINAGRKGQQLDVVHAVASTLESVFPHVSGVNVRQTTNSILVATGHPLEQSGGAANLAFTDEERAALADLDPLATWNVPPAKRVVLTDDRAPIEWLTNAIIFHELRRMGRAAMEDS